MTDAESQFLNERMRALRAYISLLERVQHAFLGLGLDDHGRAVLVAIDRKVSLAWQVLSVVGGVSVFIILAYFSRFVARSPALLVGAIVIGALAGMFASAWIFWQARRRLLRGELRTAVMQLAQLEDQSH